MQKKKKSNSKVLHYCLSSLVQNQIRGAPQTARDLGNVVSSWVGHMTLKFRGLFYEKEEGKNVF